MMSPTFGLSLYLLLGVAVFFWSEPYRPQSAAAFAHCFRMNRLVWMVMVLIASMLWPVMLANMTYRYFFPGRKEDQDADR